MAPWNTKLTELRGALVQLYPEKEDGRMVVEMAGIPPGSIAFSERATVNWHNILREANKRKKVQDIVQIAIQEYPEREDLALLFTEVEQTDPLTSAIALHQKLGSETPRSKKLSIPTPARPAAAPASAGPKPYDILVPSRKGLEKMVGSDDLIDIISWVEGARKQSMTVCKIEKAEGESGTGFLLKGGYVMTNNHVIPDAETAGKSRLTFNYKVDQDNNVMTESLYRLDPTVFFMSHEDELDYTVVKVVDDPARPLADWGHVVLEDFFDPNLHEKVTVIQHPKGNYMKMALPDDIISIWDKYLFYTTDTREGSSGSPVFNKHWKVVALHHAGKNEQSYEGGLRINADGEIRPSNRGILIKRIIEDLKRQSFTLPQ